jgi:hypothetical protein
MPNSTTQVAEATTDIRDLQRIPTTGLIEIEMDYSAAVSYCVCGQVPYTDTRPKI